MASIISDATMTVIFKEEVELNNSKYGNRNIMKVSGVNEVNQRIVSIPTSGVTVMSMSVEPTPTVGAGQFIPANLKYARFTNLDNSNFVRLTFLSSSYNRFEVKLEALSSYIFTNAKISGSAGGTVFNAYSDFEKVKATADTAAVDLEIFVASK